MLRTHGKWLWPAVIFSLTVAVRLAYLLLPGEFQPSAGLGAEMERAGASLATNGYLGDVYPGVRGPSAHVAPLYPALLSIPYRLFGVGSLGATITQSGFAILVTAVTFALFPYAASRLSLGKSAGPLAGGFLALAPLHLWVETSGSWEQPLSALVLLGLLLGFVSVSSSGWRLRPLVFGLGVLLGFAALLSPGLLPAAALVVLGELFAERHRRTQVFLISTLVILLGGAITGPWIVRNYRAFGAFIPVRGNFGLELAVGNHPDANGKTFAIAWDHSDDPMRRIHPFASSFEQARLIELGEHEYNREKLRIGLDWIRHNPMRATELVFKRFVLFWFPPSEMWSASSRASPIKSMLLSGVSALMFAGLVLLWFKGHPFRLHLSAVILGPALIFLVTHVQPRYAYPVLGISSLVAAFFFHAAFMWVRVKLADRGGRMGRERS